MDPVFFAIIGTLLGGFLLKGLEESLHGRKDTGSIAISASDDYERRWEDPDYVDMIHTTRRSEQDLFDEVYTECHCSIHLRHPSIDNIRSAITTPNEARLEIPTYRTHIVDGIRFKLPIDKVPEHATGYFDSGKVYATFVWYHPTTGVKTIMKAVPSELDYYDIHSGEFEAPIRRVEEPKPGKILKNDYASDHGPKNHMVFTASGPKMVSKSYIDNYVSPSRLKYVTCDMCYDQFRIRVEESRTRCIPCRREYQLKLQKETDESLARAIANRDIVVMK